MWGVMGNKHPHKFLGVLWEPHCPQVLGSEDLSDKGPGMRVRRASPRKEGRGAPDESACFCQLRETLGPRDVDLPGS